MKFTQNRRIGHTNLLLWFVGGIYLLYSAYKLLSLYLSDQDKDSWKALFVAAAIIFAILGLYLVITSAIRYYSKASSEDGNAGDELTDCIAPIKGDSLLCAALDEIGECVLCQRDIVSSFNDEQYKSGFSSYLKSCQRVFEKAGLSQEPSEKIGTALSHRLLRDLAAEYESLSTRTARKIMETDKKLMAFFLIPAALDLNFKGSAEFAADLNAGWNSLYPKFSFGIGRYEDIAAGFEKHLSSMFGFTTS